MADSFRFMFGRQKLLLLKLKAERSGVWFKLLSRLDRGLVDLTIRVADEVRSPRLAWSLSVIVKKIEDALQNRISQAIYKIGFPLAHKLSKLAQKWGNCRAREWAFDMSFAKFLTLMYINNPTRIES